MTADAPIFTQAIEIVVGLIVVLALGPVVRNLVQAVDRHADRTPPQGVQPDRWNSVITLPANARVPIGWLGLLERLLFFISFWLAAYELAGGWLAFKVASKWETWQALMKVPDVLGPQVDQLDYLAARNRWASNLLQRWLIGTLANGLVGLVALGVAKVLGHFITRCVAT